VGKIKMNMEKIVFANKEFVVSRIQCTINSCEYRSTRDYDKARVYALACASNDETNLNDLGDDLTNFCECNSMFSRNYIVMQSDARLRAKLLNVLAMSLSDLENETKAESYDRKVASIYEGKHLTIGVITASISDLTGQKYTKWTPSIEGAKATSQRIIPFVGDESKAIEAITRAAAQVIDDCEGTGNNNEGGSEQ
jgi:hypothetical protein